jgi:hypothetical protein
LVVNSTITNNRSELAFEGAGGIVNFGGTFELQNSIVALNESTSGIPDCRGLIASRGNNLIGDATGCSVTLLSSDLTGDPGLGTFVDNGMPGNGHFPLLANSQAINAGNDASCSERDQIGNRRKRPCDIGAIEFQPIRVVFGSDRRDFDGDGRNDIGVYRDGIWFILRSSDGGATVTGWGGLPQDIPVPGDYDGDGKADVAVYRDGTWFILRSSGGLIATGWGGLPEDIVVPADYDGDGKTDIAVYRDGAWFILRSFDGGVTATGFGGLPQDVPVPADYDGDGRTDIAVYRDGVWFVLLSGGGMIAARWGGLAQDIPVPADYDGDGKADITIYRDGLWFIRSSGGGAMTLDFSGVPQDVLVPGDYDGDGKADVAVYQDGLWFVLQSSDGDVTATGWGGLPQDIPLNRRSD